ncbi:TRMT1-like protein [Gigantopelta aegis]|uniref:TRMT1-like protein n=1 Tax=Gigantopelta aegis TaxID=1735272 RepID=UPI001B888000|nr:TRMT1-like protein [Gigantopelta aegis]
MAASTDHNVKQNDFYLVSELGITVRNDYGNTPTDKQKLYNSKLKTYREMVLATLGVFCKRHQDVVYAADVIAASGLCGLQWKKYYGDKVHVTVADRDAIDKMEDNCKQNGFTPVVKPVDSTRTPGLPLESQTDIEIRVSLCTPNVLMHLEAFHFLFVAPHKSFTNFADSAFFTLKNNGIVSFVCSNVSSFSRCPEVAQRYHGASSTKTEFSKELAARISVASIARAAARCNKGIEVLLVASVEDFLLLTVRVHRGPRPADSSMAQICRLLYCQICEDQVFLPQRKATIEDPYSLLPCDCQKMTPGRTAVELGPLWSGKMFNSVFLSEMLEEGTRLKLSTKFHLLVTSLLEEARCGESELHIVSSSGGMPMTTPQEEGHVLTDSDATQPDSENKCDMKSQGEESSKETEKFSENVATSGRTQTPSLNSAVSSDDCSNHTDSRKRIAEEEIENCKRQKLDADDSALMSDDTIIPPAFYLSLERRKNYPDVIMPKVQKVVAFLKADGYSASRTHFSATAVRTNANHSQLCKVLNKYCHKKK